MEIASGRGGVGLWQLDSGHWRSSEDGFELIQTAHGHAAALKSSKADEECLLVARSPTSGRGRIFPPEFQYDPATGKALCPLLSPDALPSWVPPFGSPPPQRSQGPRGLRQTALALNLSSRTTRSETGDPDRRLAPPPAGDFEFFSLPAQTLVPVLLALEPGKGTCYVHLPVADRWEALVEQDGLLATCHLPRDAWRAEVVRNGYDSLIFVPTDDGLACLAPDVSGLAFDVRYIGQGTALGGALMVGEQVWMPLSDAQGMVRFVSSNSEGLPGEEVVLASAIPANAFARMQAPVADGRVAVWACRGGRLVLRRLSSGAREAAFWPWPVSVTPAFEFGSPYLARDGGLWQLGFHDVRNAYVYCQLALKDEEFVESMAPRPCSGTFNFRFGVRCTTAPWLEPEHGDDGAVDELVLPLVESSVSETVLGLCLKATTGLADVLASTEAQRVVLVLDDGTHQTRFATFRVASPWRLRLFVHDRCLWAFHPLLGRVEGWGLQE